MHIEYAHNIKTVLTFINRNSAYIKYTLFMD